MPARTDDRRSFFGGAGRVTAGGLAAGSMADVTPARQEGIPVRATDTKNPWAQILRSYMPTSVGLRNVDLSLAIMM
jgi:hypothetical protein